MNKTDVSLKVDGLNIIGEVYSPEGSESHPALMLCHGIPNGSPRDPNDGGYPALAEKFCNEGFIVMIFNFRGAGLSDGNFDILGWTRDLDAAVDYLYDFNQVDKSRFSVMGFSGGAKVSVYVSAKDWRVSSLVSCCCPTRLSMLTDRINLESFIKHQQKINVNGDKYPTITPDELAEGFSATNPLRCVDRISPRPLLIIQGDSDQLVTSEQAQELYQMAGEPKEMVMVKGAGHQLRRNEDAMEAAFKWLKKVNGIVK